ncbi:MAG: AAA family ATPase, partial [Desulfobacteraceae bacterium]|nr:AAA family ATPase [Desulfobacteraceae bacterium]
MTLLFIGTTGDHAGHSLITWLIARRLVEKGLSVGFLKPFGTHPVELDGLWTDQDAVLFKEVLGLQEPFDRICPYLLSEETWMQEKPGDLLEEIKTIAKELSTGKDILLIMGSKHIFLDDASHNVSDISLNTELETDFILVDRYRDTAKSIYSILSASSLLRDRIKGIILNRVPQAKLQEIRDRTIPSLAKKGIPITIALPEDPFLSFRSLGEVRDVLDGVILCGEESIEEPVGGMTVGSSDLHGELLLFKRAYNKIVLLKPHPPEREDDPIQDRRSIAGILLTGGRNPPRQLLEAA